MNGWTTLALLAGLGGSMAMGQYQTVYAPPEPIAADEGANQGGVHFELNVSYLTDYVYRGVDYTEVADPTTLNVGGENNLDLYSDATMRFDLGERAPHPFIGVSANVYDSDPESRFQEFRPRVGADLHLQPVTFTLAMQTYVYPQRDTLETSEVYGRVLLDDSRLFGADQPVFSPYVFAAYDYDQNNGWYTEAGVSHDFLLEDISLTITPVARIAYTYGWQQQFAFAVADGDGFQHFDIGVNVSYKLNSLLNLSKRWGEWFLRGQVFHTEHLTQTTVGHSQVWGGVGIGFEY